MAVGEDTTVDATEADCSQRQAKKEKRKKGLRLLFFQRLKYSLYLTKGIFKLP